MSTMIVYWNVFLLKDKGENILAWCERAQGQIKSRHFFLRGKRNSDIKNNQRTEDNKFLISTRVASLEFTFIALKTFLPRYSSF